MDTNSIIRPKFIDRDTELGIVTAASRLGQLRSGVEKGPEHLMCGSLYQALQQSLGLTLYGDTSLQTWRAPVAAGDLIGDDLLRASWVSLACSAWSNRAYTHAMDGRTVLTLGGDHSVSIGSISGIAKAVHHRFNGAKKLGVVWVDAHASINTPQTSATPDLQDIGLRDLNEPEVQILQRNDLEVFRPYDITHLGMRTVMDQVLEYIGQSTPIYLSFDIDALDPTVAPSTGDPVAGGLTLREALYLAERIGMSGQLVGMDLIGVNPKVGSVKDRDKTLAAATAVVLRALGGLGCMRFL